MNVLRIHISLLLVIALSHFFIIKENGRNNIVFDILLIAGVLGLVVLNVYSCYLLRKRVSIPIIIAVDLSIVYYLLLFVFPIFSGNG